MSKQALRWALDMDVDIISMSWTFRKKANLEDDEHEEFAKVGHEAVASKKVLLFGSLPDKGSEVETIQVSPVGLGGVLRIGSATIPARRPTRTSTRSPGSSSPARTYGCPRVSELAKGSSFATAYAAGLAALVLYCLRAHGELTRNNPEEAERALAVARMTPGMVAIFNVLSKKHADDRTNKGAFVQPYHVFGDEFGNSEQEQEETLERTVDEILPHGSRRQLSHQLPIS